MGEYKITALQVKFILDTLIQFEANKVLSAIDTLRGLPLVENSQNIQQRTID